MPRFIASILATVLVFGARLLACVVPDRGVVACATLLRTLTRDAQTQTVLSDVARLFQNKSSARIARRLLLESRPAQLRAIVRGALR